MARTLPTARALQKSRKKRQRPKRLAPQEDQTVQKLIKDLNSTDHNQILETSRKIRQLLARENNPPIDQFVDAGVVTKLTEFLRTPSPTLQFEAAWSITNIASSYESRHTQAVVEAGAVACLIELLSSTDSSVCEQSLWALSNIAGDSAEYRDHILAHNLIPELLKLFDNPKLTLQRTLVWTISNLCRGKPSPNFALVSKFLPYLARIVRQTSRSDQQLIVEACWALSYISDAQADISERIDQSLKEGIMNDLVHLLSHDSISVRVPVLRVIGNIATGNDVQTQAIIDAMALPCLLSYLDQGTISIKRELWWLISNITAGTQNQIQAVLDSGFIQRFVPILISNAENDLKKEALFAMANALAMGSPKQVEQLVQHGAIGALCEMLTIKDNLILKIALAGLEGILVIRDLAFQQTYANEIDLFGGIEKIEALTYYPSDDEVREKARNLLNRFFLETSEEVAPVNENVMEIIGGAVSFEN